PSAKCLPAQFSYSHARNKMTSSNIKAISNGVHGAARCRLGPRMSELNTVQSCDRRDPEPDQRLQGHARELSAQPEPAQLDFFLIARPMSFRSTQRYTSWNVPGSRIFAQGGPLVWT